MDPDPDPGGPKTYGSDRSGSATQVGTQQSYVLAVCLLILVKMFIIRGENDLRFVLAGILMVRKITRLHTLLTCF
jgi:hypothetical protein